MKINPGRMAAEIQWKSREGHHWWLPLQEKLFEVTGKGSPRGTSVLYLKGFYRSGLESSLT